ncbi:class II fructose-bisphosphate aldolase [Sciscionella sediminilitoris]|uniref:class II fructose-bisphosphate aldolase n=1 Tax=Sciscionella sediminilitoris TaxID=1445613 RepID=UPI0004DFADEE|nr:class II fructose-bisphosphate aldolase [Sciscionella sp. SE31]
MPLVPTSEVLADAVAHSRGAGSFNIIAFEHIEGIISGAAAARTPVILQISHNTVRYHGGLAPLGSAALRAAEQAPVPVAVHLDHAESEELVAEAVELGFGSAMFDASTMDYAENVARTRTVVERCHAAGVLVEAELGEVGGKDGAHAPWVRTDPGEAKAFVAETGVDALAVAVGSSHAMTSRDAVLDEELIARLRDAVPVPLVLHGSSGVSDEGIAGAVAAGMRKINIATQLNKVLTKTVRDSLDADGDLVDPRKYLGPARAAVAAEITRLLGVLG